MKKSVLRNVTAVIAKVAEVFSIILAVLGGLGILAFTLGSGIIREALAITERSNPEEYARSLANNSVFFTDGHGNIAFGGACVAAVIVLITCILSAVIAGNIYKIFKKSNTESPFTDDIIKRIKTIGICAIASPVLQVIITFIGRMTTGALISFDGVLSKIFLGLVVLCLSQYFAYGAEIEKDVDGLL